MLSGLSSECPSISVYAVDYRAITVFTVQDATADQMNFNKCEVYWTAHGYNCWTGKIKTGGRRSLFVWKTFWFYWYWIKLWIIVCTFNFILPRNPWLWRNQITCKNSGRHVQPFIPTSKPPGRWGNWTNPAHFSGYQHLTRSVYFDLFLDWFLTTNIAQIEGCDYSKGVKLWHVSSLQQQSTQAKTHYFSYLYVGLNAQVHFNVWWLRWPEIMSSS